MMLPLFQKIKNILDLSLEYKKEELQQHHVVMAIMERPEKVNGLHKGVSRVLEEGPPHLLYFSSTPLLTVVSGFCRSTIGGSCCPPRPGNPSHLASQKRPTAHGTPSFPKEK